MRHDKDLLTQLKAVRQSLEVVEHHTCELSEIKHSLYQIEKRLGDLVIAIDRQNGLSSEVKWAAPATSTPKRLETKLLVAILNVLAVILGLLLIWHHDASTPPPLSRNAEPTAGATLAPFAPSPTLNTLPASTAVPSSTAPVSSSPWTLTSDGRTWNAASVEEKHKLCAALAISDRSGNSENSYFDSLNAFYKSDDGKVLSTPLGDVISHIVNGDSSLLFVQRRDK